MSSVEQMPMRHPTSHWRVIFNQFDEDHDGKVWLAHLSRDLVRDNRDIDYHVIHTIMKRAETNPNGYITFEEFLKFVNSEPIAQNLFKVYMNRYVQMFEPMCRRRRYHPHSSGDHFHVYEKQYTCFPPPLFIIFISVLQVFAHIYARMNGKYGTYLIWYDTSKRYEIWRFVSYMLVHNYEDDLHLVGNVALQIIIGVPLEMIHKFWRISALYLAGVICGSLLWSLYYKSSRKTLDGASAGGVALTTAHISSCLMNWSDMKYPYAQLTFLIIVNLIIINGGLSISHNIEDYDGYLYNKSHIGGMFGGFTVGICVQRTFSSRPWKKFLWWLCLISFIIFIVVTVSCNLFFPHLLLSPK